MNNVADLYIEYGRRRATVLLRKGLWDYMKELSFSLSTITPSISNHLNRIDDMDFEGPAPWSHGTSSEYRCRIPKGCGRTEAFKRMLTFAHCTTQRGFERIIEEGIAFQRCHIAEQNSRQELEAKIIALCIKYVPAPTQFGAIDGYEDMYVLGA